MSLQEQLINAALSVLSEGKDSSKEMIANNIVASFDEMGMAKANPGEFSPEEITDKANLTNTAEMSNDTNFEGKVDGQNDMASGIIDAMNDLTNDMVDISVGNEQCDHCHPKNEEKELHILEFGESYLGKYIDKLLGGKTCEEYLQALTESNYAGPLDFVPDLRINVSDVITTLKREIGEGSEGIHVDQVYDKQHNNAYKVSQVDEKLLPKKIQVEKVLLELGDDNIYYVNKPSDTYPMAK